MCGVVRLGENFVRLLPGSMALSADVADAQGEDAFGGHDLERRRAGLLAEQAGSAFPSSSPAGTLSVVQRRYFEPGVSLSVERMTMWPENGSSWNMYSKPAWSLSSGTTQAIRPPSARLMDISVWRTRRIVPARSMARMRSMTMGRSTPLGGRSRRAGRSEKPWMLVFGDGEDAGVDGVGDVDGEWRSRSIVLDCSGNGRMDCESEQARCFTEDAELLCMYLAACLIRFCFRPGNLACPPTRRDGRYMLKAGGVLNGLEQTCVACELDPTVDSVGVGGLPDASGEVSLDGAMMLSPARSAGVAYVRKYPHPVSIARRVMERRRINCSWGRGRSGSRRSEGFATGKAADGGARAKWEAWRTSQKIAEMKVDGGQDPPHDTIGVLGLDAGGPRGACSTSGRAFKLPGRVGDSPLIAHGLYCDPRRGRRWRRGRGSS